MWLKFITPAFPVGLWTGNKSARKFETEQEGQAYLAKLTDALLVEYKARQENLAG